MLALRSLKKQFQIIMANKNQEEETKLEELNKWFNDNPKLPEEINGQLLKRFLKCMHGNVDETKRLIEHNYTLRNQNPHIFLDRDPSDKDLQEFHELHDIIALPGLTPEGNRLVFFRLNKCEPSKMNSLLECKVFHMVADCRFTMLDTEEKTKIDIDDDNIEPQMAEGDIQVVDIGNYSLSHLARIAFFTIRTHLRFLQEAYPVRMRAMHIINCPSFLNKMIAIGKPFISDEVYNLIHYHTNGLESLYEHVPKDMLPNEYGGKAGTIAELKSEWDKILIEKREYLMDPKQWKVEQQPRSTWSWW